MRCHPSLQPTKILFYIGYLFTQIVVTLTLTLINYNFLTLTLTLTCATLLLSTLLLP